MPPNAPIATLLMIKQHIDAWHMRGATLLTQRRSGGTAKMRMTSTSTIRLKRSAPTRVSGQWFMFAGGQRVMESGAPPAGRLLRSLWKVQTKSCSIHMKMEIHTVAK